MKKLFAAALTALVLTASAPAAMASHEDTIIGAAIGGAVGAALGHEISGRSGAILMGAAGSAAGAMIGRNMEPPYRERVVTYDNDYEVRHVHVPVERVYYVQPARYQTVYYYRDDPRHHRHHRRYHDDD